MYIIFFDICATIIFAMIVFAIFYRKTYTTFSGKYFLMMQCVGLLSTLFDLLAVLKYEQNFPIQFFNYLYFLFHSMIAILYAFYVIRFTDCLHLLKNNKLIYVLFFIPYIIYIIFLFANIGTGWLFRIENLEYHRGPAYLLTHFVAAFYIGISLFVVIHYKKSFTWDKITALVSIAPFIIAALIAQVLVDNLLIENLAISVASYMIAMVVERPEEVFEIEIGLKKYAAFATDIQKSERTKKKIAIVYVKVINVDDINKQLNYSEMVLVKRQIREIIRHVALAFQLSAEYYWLGNGVYSIVFDSNREQASEYAKKLRKTLNGSIDMHFSIIDLYTNVAVANFPEDLESAENCLSFADIFNHREVLLDDIHLVSQVTNKRDFEIRVSLSQIIKFALISHNFIVYYQPIYTIGTKDIHSAEALVRLNDDKFGIISPSLFVPEAERSGAIHQIGDFILETVCEFIASEEFKTTGLEYIEVNLSVVQCMQENLPEHIMSILRKYHVHPRFIMFEITESADAYSMKLMVENVHKLKAYGFNFALDDYGTGYSNVERVASLPLDLIKFDMSFSHSIYKYEMKIVLEQTIQMLKKLGKEIVVEGVETKELLDTFISLGVDHIQGYYFSEPVPRNALVEYLIQSNLKKEQ